MVSCLDEIDESVDFNIDWVEYKTKDLAYYQLTLQVA